MLQYYSARSADIKQLTGCQLALCVLYGWLNLLANLFIFAALTGRGLCSPPHHWPYHVHLCVADSRIFTTLASILSDRSIDGQWLVVVDPSCGYSTSG